MARIFKWCWKTWMHEKMILKHKLLESLYLHVQELNCDEIFYEQEVHVGEEALNLNLMPNLGLVRKNHLASFSIHLLENV